MASGVLGDKFDDTFFKIVAVVVTVVVVVFWLVVLYKSIQGAINGSLFFEMGEREIQLKNDAPVSQMELRSLSPSGSTIGENGDV